MFHFRRRTLWIIIYITIPLIIILNNLQSEPESATTVELATHFSLDTLELDCLQSICQLKLPGSDSVQLSVLLSELPAASVPLPDFLQLQTQLQGGLLVAKLDFQAGPRNIKQVLAFLRQWLPPAVTGVVVSGAQPDALSEEIAALIPKLTATSGVLPVEPVQGLGVLASPPFGSDSQLAFLLWVEALKSRLSGYQISVSWDHRRAESYALFNSSLSKDLFYPVTDAELAPILAAYQATAGNRQRSAQQLHRYATSAVLYNVPFEYFVSQPQRLAAVTLNQINEMREFALGQITQSE